MTTLELYRKHKKGEIGRDRFLYEVRRDINLPWITNITSYDDAVKILKNKGIIREAQFEPQNIPTDPLVDRINPYALKREVEKLLAKEPELTNDSYKLALNKAAKKLTTPEAVKKAMFANADTVAKADAKLQTQAVKKNNLKDKHNEMKKAKGQQTPKATAAPTKENKKTKKPKGVKVMPDKGVEGSQKIIKEISSYIKKKLTENSAYSGFHEGMVVPTPHGEGTIKDIVGGTLGVQCEDGKLYDVQMNVVSELMKQAKEQAEQRESIDVRALGGHEGGMKLADKLTDAIEMYKNLDADQRKEEFDRLKEDIPAKLVAKLEQLMDALHDESNYPAQEEDPNLKEYVSSDLEILRQIKALKMDRAQAMRDMKQETEPEGGPIADDYADRLMDLDKQIKSLEAQLYKEDLDEDLEETATGAIITTDTGVEVGTAKNPTDATTKAKNIKRRLPTAGRLTVKNIATGQENQV